MKTSKIKADGTEVTNSVLPGAHPPKKTGALKSDPFNEDDDDYDLSQDENLDALEDVDLDYDDDDDD